MTYVPPISPTKPPKDFLAPPQKHLPGSVTLRRRALLSQIEGMTDPVHRKKQQDSDSQLATKQKGPPPRSRG